jgi:hypothetical protein
MGPLLKKSTKAAATIATQVRLTPVARRKAAVRAFQKQKRAYLLHLTELLANQAATVSRLAREDIMDWQMIHETVVLILETAQQIINITVSHRG